MTAKTAYITTSPLDRIAFGSPFCASPTATERLASPVSPRTGTMLDDHEPLCFPKMPIAYSSSTESDAFSDTPSLRLSTSPSLLTSMLLSQKRSRSNSFSRQPSSSGSSQPGIVTPVTSDCGGCKPILRRDTTCSTSASDDGFSCDPWKPFAAVVDPAMSRRKSCLKFAVASKRTSLSISPAPFVRGESGKICKSPAPVKAWADLPCALPVECDSEDDLDDGYIEDEEDGFDSDEEVGTFSGRVEWASRFPARDAFERNSSKDGDMGDLDVFGESGSVASGSRPAPRGRTVSIVGAFTDRACSRHISPPPPEFDPSAVESAPPAARSPSAADLCRRRDSGLSRRGSEQIHCFALKRECGFKSDEALSTMSSSGINARKASLPDDKPLGILRCTAVASDQRRRSAPSAVKLGMAKVEEAE